MPATEVGGDGWAELAGLGPGREFDRIRAFVCAVRAPAVQIPGSVLLGDDAAALVPPAGESLVVSTDLCIEGVHFQREWTSWEEVGFRATAAALSDLAAMAAAPLGALVSLALPPESEGGMAVAMGEGVGECLRRHDAPLLGGDLVASPARVIVDVIVLGSSRRPVRRLGARPGDELWVTGRLGGAALAVHEWLAGREPASAARRAFARPSPRLREAPWLAERAELHALIDLSDGLASDASHVAAASGACLEFDVDRIPLDPVVEEIDDRSLALRLALSGGEDYELLVVAAPGAIERLLEEWDRDFCAELTRIGRVIEGSGLRWVDASGGTIQPPEPGFDHFAPAG